MKRVEAERAEKQRLRDAVDAAHVHIIPTFCDGQIIEAFSFLQTNHIAKTSDLLSFLRLHSLLSAGHSPALAPNLDAQESSAVFSTSNILLGDERDQKQIVLSGILSGVGDYEGVPCKSPF